MRSSTARMASVVWRRPPVTASGKSTGHENTVDLIHDLHEFLAPPHIIPAQSIEDVAAQLTDDLGHAVEVGGWIDSQRLGGRYVLPGNNGEGDVGFRELLAGVVHEAGVVYERTVGADVLRLSQPRPGRGDQPLGFFEVGAVNGPNGIGR